MMILVVASSAGSKTRFAPSAVTIVTPARMPKFWIGHEAREGEGEEAEEERHRRVDDRARRRCGASRTMAADWSVSPRSSRFSRAM